MLKLIQLAFKVDFRECAFRATSQQKASKFRGRTVDFFTGTGRVVQCSQSLEGQMQVLRLPVVIISSVALLVAQMPPGFAQNAAHLRRSRRRSARPRMRPPVQP